MAKQSALKVPTGLSPEKQAKVDAILKKYEEQNRQIEREHAKEMAKLYGGAALQIGSAFIPGTLGLKLAGGAIKGLVPIVGRKIAQNVATGVTSGLASGAVEGLGRGLMENQNPLKTMATDSLAGGLLGGLGGYGLGKVAQKLNTQTAWHGSPYKFDKFSNEAIGTGEGAQAHGYGHYTALNKDVADKYRETLSEIPYNEKIQSRLWSDLKNDRIPQLKENEERELFEYISNNLTPSEFNTRRLKNYFNDLETPQAKEFAEKLLNELENNNNQGNLYKLSIPKDDVMLREDLPLSQQPIKVQEVLRDYFNQNPLQKHERRFFEDIENPDLLETTTGGNLYRQIARNVLRPDKNMKQREANAIATQILQDKGIKGISYNGGIDGEANVIFNPDDIDIIPYYDNPTSFKEKFINLLNR